MVKDLARLLSPQRRGPLGLADLAQAGRDLLELMQRLLRTAHKPHDGAPGRLWGLGGWPGRRRRMCWGSLQGRAQLLQPHPTFAVCAQTRRPTPPRWKGM